MDVIIAALVGGIFTLIATVLASYRREIMEILKKSSLDVSGVWSGHCERIPLSEPFSSSDARFEIGFTLEQTGRRVSGRGFMRDESLTGEVELEIKITHSRYLIVEWHDPDQNAMDRGVAILELVNYGRTLRGLYLALPVDENRLICGNISVSKN